MRGPGDRPPGTRNRRHPCDPGALCHPSTRCSLGPVGPAIRTERRYEPPRSVLMRRPTIQQWPFRRTDSMPKVHVVHICPDPGGPRMSGANVVASAWLRFGPPPPVSADVVAAAVISQGQSGRRARLSAARRSASDSHASAGCWSPARVRGDAVLASISRSPSTIMYGIFCP